MTRRDSLGRKIGRNWWRELNVQIMRDANFAVDAIEGTNHQMEPAEFRTAQGDVQAVFTWPCRDTP